jgi:hypothetical protein
MENIEGDEKYIALICNGIFNSIPDITIGELFENFCDNVNYNVIINEYGTYVDFTGNCNYDDENTKLMIRFKVDYKKNVFGIIFIKLGNSMLDEDMSLELLEAMADESDVEMLDEEDIYDDSELYNELLSSPEPYDDEDDDDYMDDYYDEDYDDDDDDDDQKE